MLALWSASGWYILTCFSFILCWLENIISAQALVFLGSHANLAAAMAARSGGFRHIQQIQFYSDFSDELS